VPASFYFLHTYPHGWKNVLAGRIFYARQLPQTSTIVTVSDYARRALSLAWRLDSAGPQALRIYSTAGQVVNRERDTTGPLMVLTVGTVAAYKDPIGWIGLARRVRKRLADREVRFTWVGDGPLLARCQELVQADNGGISFVGNRATVDPYFLKADVYVQSSRVESLGLSALDAARHGVPSIVTAVGGLPETVDPGVSGFVVRSMESPEAVESLLRVVTDDALRRRMGEAQRTFYSQRFLPQEWESQIRALHSRTLPSN
jgi:glycosyltransferase involved in cell wall biosynthesis